MQWGLYLLNVGPFHDPRTLVDLARAAEDSGWDGFFLADNLAAGAGVPVVDTWSTLAAIASQTRRIRLGPLVTALPRRHLGGLARGGSHPGSPVGRAADPGGGQWRRSLARVQHLWAGAH